MHDEVEWLISTPRGVNFNVDLRRGDANLKNQIEFNGV